MTKKVITPFLILFIICLLSHIAFAAEKEKRPLNFADIEKLLNSGVVSNAVIIKLITGRGINFVVTEENLEILKNAGADNAVIEAIKQASAEYKHIEPAETAKKKENEICGNTSSVYEEAYSAFKDRKYKEARQKFDAFIKEFPKGKLADDAQFWIAETYYSEKDFEGAIFAYETLLKKYPNSEKAPAALLKQGFSFIEVGDKKTGKVLLEQLIELYPNSKEAELAKKKLKEIVNKKNSSMIEKLETYKGHIYVNSDPPSANIYIDGTYKADTPAELSLLPGEYMVMFIRKNYKVETIPLNIKKGINLPLSVRLSPD